MKIIKKISLLTLLVAFNAQALEVPSDGTGLHKLMMRYEANNNAFYNFFKDEIPHEDLVSIRNTMYMVKMLDILERGRRKKIEAYLELYDLCAANLFKK